MRSRTSTSTRPSRWPDDAASHLSSSGSQRARDPRGQTDTHDTARAGARVRERPVSFRAATAQAAARGRRDREAGLLAARRRTATQVHTHLGSDRSLDRGLTSVLHHPERSAHQPHPRVAAGGYSGFGFIILSMSLCIGTPDRIGLFWTSKPLRRFRRGALA